MSLLDPNLQAFMAVSQQKTVHGAAEAIHLSQTGVTQRIRALERKLRASLFVRTRRGMLLTPEGEALLRYCLTIKEFEGEVLAKIQGAATINEVHVCITGPSSLTDSRLVPQLIPVMKKFPKLTIQFDVNDIENRHQQLKRGECQFAILQPQDVEHEMEHKILKPENYVLVCAPAWRKRKLEDIIQQEHLIDFDPTDQLSLEYFRHFKLPSYAKQNRHFVNRPEALAQLIIQELGFGLLSTEIVKPYIANKQLIILNNNHIYQQPHVLAWYHRPEPPAYIQAIIKAIC